MKRNESLTSNQILVKSIVSKEFKEDAVNYKNENEYFEFFSASQILKNLNLSNEELSDGIVGGSNDGGCDAIYVLLNGERVTSDMLSGLMVTKGSILELIIIQAKMTMGFSEDAIMKFKTTSENLLQLDCDNKEYEKRYNEDVLVGFKLFRDIITTYI